MFSGTQLQFRYLYHATTYVWWFYSLKQLFFKQSQIFLDGRTEMHTPRQRQGCTALLCLLSLRMETRAFPNQTMYTPKSILLSLHKLFQRAPNQGGVENIHTLATKDPLRSLRDKHMQTDAQNSLVPQIQDSPGEPGASSTKF